MNRVMRCVPPAPRALILLLGLAIASLATLPVGLAAGASALDGRPTPGQHIYDTTGLLTTDEIANLEQHATLVEQAGAPCVVYLQAKDATQAQTLQDAGDLMNRWDIESKTGAHDGFVMYFNLQPGNLRHGQVVLFAGQKWFTSSLPQDETQRIYNDVMLPSLASADTAQAIADGLDAVAQDLQNGPPKPTPPSAAELAFQSFGRVPFNVLAALYALALVIVAMRAVRSEPPHTASEPRATPPGELAPAMVAALLQSKINDAQMEGTVLDFGRRGMLTIESKDDDDISIQLGKKKADLSEYEATVWSGITAAANGQDRVTHASMPAIRNTWQMAKAELHASLIKQGWLESHAESRRTLLYGLGAAGVLGACLGFVIALIAQEGWAVIGALVILFGAIAAFAFAHSLSELTPAGEAEIGPWRGYATVLQTGYPQLSHDELDTALPYSVALAYRDELASSLRAADTGENAYSPSWFRMGGGRSLGFYPYWIGWHTAMYPPPPPTSSGGGGFSGGFGGGGAAGGGGGGGGGF